MTEYKFKISDKVYLKSQKATGKVTFRHRVNSSNFYSVKTDEYHLGGIREDLMDKIR